MKILKKIRSSEGLTMVEVLITAAVFGILALIIAKSFFNTHRLSVNATDQMEAARLSELIINRMQSANYYHVLGADSSTKAGNCASTSAFVSGSASYPTNYLVLWATSPMLGTLNDIETQVIAAGFTRWRIQVQAVRRDSSDTDNDASYVDFIPFSDSNRDSHDEYDTQLAFQGCNGDNDFNDVCGSSPEFPDSHMKQVDVFLYKGSRQYSRLGFLLSQEKLTGNQGISGESPLKFNVDDPWGGCRIYTRTPANQLYLDTPPVAPDFFRYWDYTAIPAAKAWKDGARRVDTASNLTLSVYSQSGAQFEIGYSTQFPDPDPTNRTFLGGIIPQGLGANIVAANGTNRVPIDPVTSNANELLRDLLMQERYQVLFGRANQGGQYSPWNVVPLYTDATPPRLCTAGAPCPAAGTDILQPAANETINTRTFPPFAVVIDTPSPGGYAAAGLVPSVMSMATMTVAVPAVVGNIEYNQFKTETQATTPKGNAGNPAVVKMIFVDTTTLMPHLLTNAANGKVNMRAEFGDAATYRSSHTWGFMIDDAAYGTDVSTPVIAPISPLGVTGLNPAIQFNVSDGVGGTGANPYSLRIYISTPSVAPSFQLFFSTEIFTQPGAFIPLSSYTKDGAFGVNFTTTTLVSTGTYGVQIMVQDHRGNANDFTLFPATWSFEIP
jgi:type II secretory pathway pseudopilin PulG